ncbi:hypothetical protein ACQEU8_31670 [Streptomyces sp. CA-250714]|uniref:hypothetical protein n=1 Tax=Streptomyces sp. CA-250714 TaxID=3240060 RepID=UPI003D915972
MPRRQMVTSRTSSTSRRTVMYTATHMKTGGMIQNIASMSATLATRALRWPWRGGVCDGFAA